MLKQISRLFRDQLEKKLFNNRDKVDYSIKADRSRNYHRYKRAKGFVHSRSCCEKFNPRQAVRNSTGEQQTDDDKTETCRTSDYLKYNSWFEAFGLVRRNFCQYNYFLFFVYQKVVILLVVCRVLRLRLLIR